MKKRMSITTRNRLKGYGFLIPNIIGFTLFTFLPVLASLFISFTDWDGFSQMNFVGLDNYIKMFSDRIFLISLKNTLYFSIGSVPVMLIIALLIAVALNEDIKGMKLYRAAFFLPHVTATVAIATVWQLLYHPTMGPINEFLRSIGIANPPSWLSSSTWAMPAVIIMTIWKTIGYYMIIFLAGLQGIPINLYEAANIDGANGWQKFKNITIPMLSPVIFFATIIAVIRSFKVFTNIYCLTEGGPGHATNVLVYNIYVEAFSKYRFGYASAMAYILFMIILVITLIQFKGQKKWVNY